MEQKSYEERFEEYYREYLEEDDNYTSKILYHLVYEIYLQSY